jgi:hypothetical protein
LPNTVPRLLAMRRPPAPSPSRRLLVRDGGSMSMRVEWGMGFRSGSSLPSWATVEWAGRIGHPSSYGLLGGAPLRAPGIGVIDEGGRFAEALATSGDDVSLGVAT